MICRYIKKSLAVEAVQWDGYNANEIKEFVGSNFSIVILHSSKGEKMYIHSSDGELTVLGISDYLVKEADGNFYLCRSGLFDISYSRLDA